MKRADVRMGGGGGGGRTCGRFEVNTCGRFVTQWLTSIEEKKPRRWKPLDATVISSILIIILKITILSYYHGTYYLINLN